MTCPATYTDPETGTVYPCRSYVGPGHLGYHWCRPEGLGRDLYWLTETEAETTPDERRILELEAEVARLRSLLAASGVDP